MSADDQISIVKFRGRYYVAHVGGGNWILAVINGQSYATLEEAENASIRFGWTEYGICYDSKLTDSDVYNELIRDTRWESILSSELKQNILDYQTKVADLHQLATEVNVVIRSDSQLVKVYLSEGLDGVSKLTQGKVKTLSELFESIALMAFLYEKTRYAGFCKQYKFKYEIEKIKNIAIAYFVKNNLNIDLTTIHPLVRLTLTNQIERHKKQTQINQQIKININN